MKRLRIGIIGFGYMGHFHYNKIMECNRGDVVAICDCDKKRLEEGKNLDFRCYHDTDVKSFLDEELDLVVIATPNQFHAPYSIMAMEAGCNVMCEKPVTMNLEEMEQIIYTSLTTGKLFTVHQQRRFDIDYLIVKDVVNSMKIGNIHTIESRIMGERGVCFGWRADPESGGGMLYDWGVHLIDQILNLFPDATVESVYARLCSILTPAVDDYFELKLELSNKVVVNIMVCTFALQKLPRWFVFGDRGTMKLDSTGGSTGGIGRIKQKVKGFESVIGKRGLGPSRTMAPLEPEYLETLQLPEKKEEPLKYWENLIAAVEGWEKPFVSLKDLKRQMEVVATAFESAQNNAIIKVHI